MSHAACASSTRCCIDRDDTFCDLAFAPWPDMEAARCAREGLPLFGLESRRPARQFDLIGFSLGYELGYTNVLTMIDLAGLAAARGRPRRRTTRWWSPAAPAR